MRKWAILLGGALLVTAPPAGDETVYFFFSLEAPGARTARSLRGFRRVRPCLLVEEFRTPASPGPEFLETVKALGGQIPIFDPEGLALARKFGIRRLPAVVVDRGERVHVFYGADLTPEDLSCSK